MCGIVGYIGKREAAPILIEGLQALEYRGYDSAGLYVSGFGALKRAGKVVELQKALPEGSLGRAGIAHTRWATHGPPTEENAHPHTDTSGEVWVVHNGIIENYAELRDGLEQEGAIFRSDTDTEVLAHLIARAYRPEVALEAAVAEALTQVRGTYGLAVMSKREPEKLVATRFGSPLLIGIGSGELYIASDATPLLPHTRSVIYLDDGELAILTPELYTVVSAAALPIEKRVSHIEWDLEAAQKKGHEHFMLKEILEIPEVIENTLRGRIALEEGRVVLGGLRDVADRLKSLRRIIITGCGSAYYAGLVGQELIEEFAGVPVEVEIASEIRYRRFTADPEHTVLIAVSQSGETADTLEAVRIARRHGMLTLGVVNVVGASIARETDAGVYNHAGPEVGVASTKGFISQVVVLALIALTLGRERGQDRAEVDLLLRELSELPEKAREVLRRKEAIQALAPEIAESAHALYLGRKYQCPVAYEGALKLKEISYIHAEGYGAGEMKHGPIALIEPGFPIVALAPKDSLYEKVRSNLEEVLARGAKVIAITTDDDVDLKRLTPHVLSVPVAHEALLPILTTIPLHLLAYYVALSKDLPIDQPRNLAKSVTVE